MTPRIWSGLGAAYRLVWRACPRPVCGYVLGTVLAGFLPVVTVWLMSRIADAIVDGSPAKVLALACGVVAFGLVNALLPLGLQYLLNEMARVSGRAAQTALYAATERITGLGPFEDPEFRDRLRIAQFGGRTGPAQAVDGSLGLLQGVITIGGLAVVLAAINPLITVLALAAAVPAIVAEIRVSRERADVLLLTSPMERREFFYTELLTSIEAAKEVRLLGLGGLFRRRMMAELTVADGRRRSIDGRELRVQSALGVLAAAVTGLGLVWTVLTVGRGGAGVGGVIAYIAAMGGLQAAVSAQVTRVASVHQSITVFDHYRFVEAIEADLDEAGACELPALERGIEFRDVWFRYSESGPWVLSGVDLYVPHGSALALVGLNGAGKSTLIKLLCRFYDPVRGQILWDGVDIRDVPAAALRDRIGAVFQDYMAYDLTAAENVGLGDVAVMSDHGLLRDAAARAGIDATLDSLPHGYDTMLSLSFAEEGDTDGGVLLSGGQWQRLALARAFMRDRRDLLILDEPSSGLDAQAEHEVHTRLRQHRRGATSVLISHRLGSIRDADHIAVLAGGRIVESGTHDELVDDPHGAYARLFRLQADGYRDPVVAQAGGVRCD